MTSSRILRSAVAAVALMATASSFALAQGGRLSLAERVERLERQQQGSAADTQQQASSVDLLNRITQLQTEVQVLRGMIEEQDFKLSELERRNRDLAVDFDARLERLEGGSAAGNAQRIIDPEPVPAAGNLGGVVGAAAGADTQSEAPLEGSPAATPGLQNDALAQPADPAAERAAYDAAFEALKNGQYAEAARRFQGFLSQYPGGEYAPNAQYWLGESYYVTQNYQIALDAFERLLSQFPTSNKVPDALLKVGYSHYELRNWDRAEETLNQVIRSYPDSTVARLAQGRLRALRLEHRQ